MDMRIDLRQTLTATDVVNTWPEEDLSRAILSFGEEHRARRIAHAIVKQRRFGPLLRTSQLSDLVSRTVARGRQGIHPATRTFQALRIAVNRELDEIDAFLSATPFLLAADGRLAVISFHSLEDRRSKFALRNQARNAEFVDLLPGGVVASREEQRKNPRSRSARLRAIRRVTA